VPEVSKLTIKKAVLYDQTAQDCTEYQPIQTLKSSMDALEIAEDTECDSCIHFNKGQCDVYLK
jgi:hypothetical protein